MHQDNTPTAEAAKAAEIAEAAKIEELQQEHRRWDPSAGCYRAPAEYCSIFEEYYGERCIPLDAEPDRATEVQHSPGNAQRRLLPDEPRAPLTFWDPSLRWMRAGGLPLAISRGTGSPSAWPVFHELVLRDHQPEHPTCNRRFGPGGRYFSVPLRELTDATGASEATLYRVLKRLAASRLLAHYRPGKPSHDRRGGAYSHFGINGGTMRELFDYIAPRLHWWPGGAQGLDLDKSKGDGWAIYSGQGQVQMVSWQDYDRLRKASANERPNVDILIGICGL